MNTIVHAFITHTLNVDTDAPVMVTRDQRFALKQAEVNEIRSQRCGADALSAARSKSVSVCKRIIADMYPDAMEDYNAISNAMEVLATAWGQPIEKVIVPESMKAANEALNFWRRQL